MSATLPDVVVSSDQYTSLNTITGIPIGTGMLIQLKGSSEIRIVESVTQPANSVVDGVVLTTLRQGYATAKVQTGSIEVWVICVKRPTISSTVSSNINVQEF
jgi:hypothetical protein